LWSLNNHVAFGQAQHFAARLVKEAGDDPEAWVQTAWAIALGRAPSESEKEEALTLLHTLDITAERQPLEDPPAPLATIEPRRARALAGFCLAMFNLNEFVFVD
jgi:hypothetical protein